MKNAKFFLVLLFTGFFSCEPEDPSGFVPRPQGNPIFYLSDNGITCICENVIAGDKGFIKGVEFEAVDNHLLRKRYAEGKDMSKLCTSLVTEMRNLFQYNGNFNQPIGNWDVSNVTSMLEMFSRTNFNQPIEAWDVSKVADMTKMFFGSAFNQPIGAWNVSKVTSMREMFGGGDDGGFEDYEAFFNQPIGEWDVSNVTKMDGMFGFNNNFNQDLSKWCVVKIPQIPAEFATAAWTLPKPVWGTCPD